MERGKRKSLPIFAMDRLPPWRKVRLRLSFLKHITVIFVLIYRLCIIPILSSFDCHKSGSSCSKNPYDNPMIDRLIELLVVASSSVRISSLDRKSVV